MMSFLSPLDIASVLWFFSAWIGYTRVADSRRLENKSVIGVMNEHRRRWMAEMLHREIRILDSMILNHLQSGIAIFASTSILAVGILVASLGATDKTITVLSTLPYVGESSRPKFEVQVLLLLLIFIYAFFKFIWSHRLYSYCAVLIGALPNSANIDAEAERYADRAAQIGDLASRHFNRGLRAFYFALSALAWLLHPLFFIVATAWVGLVLYRRDFRSRSLRVVRGDT